MIAFGYSGEFAYATLPSLTWDSVGIPNASSLWAVLPWEGNWYAVDSRDDLRIATNGPNGVWQIRSDNDRDLLATEDRLLSIGGNGRVGVRIAGDEFVKSAALSNQPLYGVAYNDGVFVCVGDNGLIATSIDGLLWKAAHSNTGELLARVQGANGRWVVDGPRTSYLSADGGVSWFRARREPSSTTGLDQFVAEETGVTVGPEDGIYFYKRARRSAEVVQLDKISLVVGEPFDADVIHHGNAARYTVAGLPPGLSAEGRRITGIPEAPGMYRILLGAGGLFNQDYEPVNLIVHAGRRPVQDVDARIVVSPGEAFAIMVRLQNRVETWEVEGLPEMVYAEVTRESDDGFLETYRNGVPVQDSENVSGSKSLILNIASFASDQIGYYQWDARMPGEAGSVLESITVWYGLGTTWEDWLEAIGLRGDIALPESDWDGNGVPLLIDFALGRAPHDPQPIFEPSNVREEGVIRYRKPVAIAGVAVEVETSTDLHTWFPLPPGDHILESLVEDSHEVWRADLGTAMAVVGAKKLWWRLRASLGG